VIGVILLIIASVVIILVLVTRRNRFKIARQYDEIQLEATHPIIDDDDDTHSGGPPPPPADSIALERRNGTENTLYQDKDPGTTRFNSAEEAHHYIDEATMQSVTLDKKGGKGFRKV
jgi:hypothetical protein